MKRFKAEDKTIVKTIAMLLEKYCTVLNLSCRQLAINSTYSDVVLRRLMNVWKNDVSDAEITFKVVTALAAIKSVVANNKMTEELKTALTEFVSEYAHRDDVKELSDIIDKASESAKTFGKLCIVINGVTVIADVSNKALLVGNCVLKHAEFDLSKPVPEFDLTNSRVTWYGIPLSFINPLPKDKENEEAKKLQLLLDLQKARGVVTDVSPSTVAFLYLNVTPSSIVDDYSRVEVTDRMTFPEIMQALEKIVGIEDMKVIIITAQSRKEEQYLIEAVVDFWRTRRNVLPSSDHRWGHLDFVGFS